MTNSRDREALIESLVCQWWQEHPDLRKDASKLWLEPGEFLRCLVQNLDLSNDGILSVIEIRRAILRPSEVFTPTEVAFLRLLEKYYLFLRELDNEKSGPDTGISPKDLSSLQAIIEKIAIETSIQSETR